MAHCWTCGHDNPDARLRSEIERFGGTVEKFIGDAVMAVFGAPPDAEIQQALTVLRPVGAAAWVNEAEALFASSA